MKRRYLYFAVFSSGMVTLAVELAASRLLGTVFGTSNLVWASIIGLILIYLTVGYFIGGKWADKFPEYKYFYLIMLWGAFTAGVIPLISRPVLRFAADAFDQLDLAVLFGSFFTVLVLFIVPIVLLGTMSPFAIRLAIKKPEEAGQLSGRIYAVSTLGSFIGTFLPVLIFIPLIGTTNTFLVFSFYLMLVALAGMTISDGWKSGLKWSWLPILLLILALVLGGGMIKQSAGQIYEVESAYNYIQVIEKDGTFLLRLNEGQGYHSRYEEDNFIYYGPWMQFLAGPFFNEAPHGLEEVERIAIVGLAAGTTARQATEVFGNVPIDGFEIDPKIIEVGQEYFGMNMPNLNAIAEDGRWGLEHSEYQYDLIAVDAYRPPYIPFHLTTVEFFQIAKEHLTEDGVLVINAGRSPDYRSLVDALAATLSEVFPTVHVIDVPNTFNTMIYATMQATSFDNLLANYYELEMQLGDESLLLQSMATAYNEQQPTVLSDVVFTDDKAPIEWIVNNMVVSFLMVEQTVGAYE